jgi:integrase
LIRSSLLSARGQVSEPYGLRVHDLRHTVGTLATAAGGSLREVMDRLGHSTTVAAVRYQHVMADRDAAIARELNRLIEGG